MNYMYIHFNIKFGIESLSIGKYVLPQFFITTKNLKRWTSVTALKTNHVTALGQISVSSSGSYISEVLF